jgi:HPt (histidine-containing phosphotransfer) domain-containing protein
VTSSCGGCGSQQGRGRKETNPREEDGPAGGRAESAQVPCDLDKLREKTLHDRSFLADLLRIFREDRPRHVDRLREAIRRQDGPELHRSAHAFFGSLRILEAFEASRLAHRLEDMAEAGDFEGARPTLEALDAESERLVAFLEDA